jgi:hypothetical protein
MLQFSIKNCDFKFKILNFPARKILPGLFSVSRRTCQIFSQLHWFHLHLTSEFFARTSRVLTVTLMYAAIRLNSSSFPEEIHEAIQIPIQNKKNVLHIFLSWCHYETFVCLFLFYVILRAYLNFEIFSFHSPLLNYPINILRGVQSSSSSLRSFLQLLLTYGQPEQRSRYSDSVRDGQAGHRIPVGARFSMPEVHSTSCTMAPILSRGWCWPPTPN